MIGCLALFVLPGLLLALPQQDAANLDRPTAQWREGPIRYIITKQEDEEFRDLTTTEDRRRFISRFWALRDPEPRTLINEFRLEYWNRVLSANDLFTESTKPGWKTDRGRHYILLGAPDDRDDSPFGIGASGRATVVWRYHRAPTARIGTGLTIVFVKDGSGEYVASTDPTIVEQSIRNALPIPGDASIFGIPLPQLPPRITEMELLLDQGRLEYVPSEEELLTAIVTAEEFYGVIPFSARYDYFAGADGRTIVAITLNLHPDPLDPATHSSLPDYLIVGRIDAGGTGEGHAVFLREAQFQASSGNQDPGNHGPYIYQAVVLLPPGTYSASFAAFDRRSRKMGSYSETFEVPAFIGDTLQLSSLCLSESIEPASGEEAALRPYVIGHLKVTPRLIPAYRNGDTFAVYYQIYNSLSSRSTGLPDLRISYQFLVRQSNGFIPIGSAIEFDSVRFPAQGWSFPLRNWPAADFKLQVKVTDALSGQTAAREVYFRVL